MGCEAKIHHTCVALNHSVRSSALITNFTGLKGLLSKADSGHTAVMLLFPWGVWDNLWRVRVN